MWPEKLIGRVKPTVLVKGSDYTREEVVGREIVEALGGEIILIDIVPGHSTTSMVERTRASKSSARRFKPATCISSWDRQREEPPCDFACSSMDSRRALLTELTLTSGAAAW